MKSTILAVTVALGLTASAAMAQEAGFGNDPNASKNQVPAPSLSNPADPAAGNPGSAAQVPTAPQKQEDLNDGNAMAPNASTNSGAAAMTKPKSSNPVQ